MKEVIKSWGWEKWFANNDLYCGKLLYVKYNKWSSKGKYHYHKIKDETFFIIRGSLQLDYVTEENEFKTIILKKNDSFRVPPSMKHRFTSITFTGCEFIETSTTHRDEDSFRCSWEKVSKLWIQ